MLLDKDFIITDYPQDYEILQDGQYLNNETDLSLKPFYAYVSKQEDLSEFRHEILEQLCFKLNDWKTELESFKITSNLDQIEGFKTISPPPTLGCEYPCVPVYDPSNPHSNEEGWYCYCDYGEPEADFTNNCGCNKPTYPWTPAGCIQVEDTQLGAIGVNNVRINWGNGWGKWLHTFTDENGCWRISSDDPYNPYEAKGNEKLVIKFKNEESTIRGIRLDFDLFQYSSAVKDERIITENYNDIEILYEVDDENNNSLQKLLYYSAHMINSVQEYHDLSIENNLPLPPEDLDILMSSFTGGAAAPMLDDISNDFFDVLVQSTSCAAVASLTGNAPAIVGSGIICGYLSLYSPDIVYNYGGETSQNSGGFINTDMVKNTMYHEIAHSQHYDSNNSDPYWQSNILYVIGNELLQNNSPYGNRGDDGSERCAIIESWGNHIGYTLANEDYNGNSSLNFGGITFLIHDHINQLERFRPDILEVDNLGFPWAIDDENSWIPCGLFHDLIDDNSPVAEVIIDNIAGYTHEDCFNSILNSPNNFDDLESNLINNLPDGGNETNLLQILTEYGY